MELTIFKNQLHSILSSMMGHCNQQVCQTGPATSHVSTAFLDRTGKCVLAEGKHPLLTASLLFCDTLSEKLDQLHYGDVLLTNSAGACGFHPNGLTAIAPWYDRNGDEIKNFIAIGLWIHTVPVQFFDMTRSAGFSDFLALPPVTLLQEGSINQQIVDLMLANHSQPDQLKHSLNSMLDAMESGLDSLNSLREQWSEPGIEKYSNDLITLTRKTCKQFFGGKITHKEKVLDFVELETPADAYQKVVVTTSNNLSGLSIGINSVNSTGSTLLKLPRSALFAAVLEGFIDGTSLTTIINDGMRKFFSVAIENKNLIQLDVLEANGHSALLYQRIVDCIRQLQVDAAVNRERILMTGAPARLIWQRPGVIHFECLTTENLSIDTTEMRFNMYRGFAQPSVERLEQLMPVQVLRQDCRMASEQGSLQSVGGISRTISCSGDVQLHASIDRIRYPTLTSGGRNEKTAVMLLNGKRCSGHLRQLLNTNSVLDMSTAHSV